MSNATINQRVTLCDSVAMFECKTDTSYNLSVTIHDSEDDVVTLLHWLIMLLLLVTALVGTR